MTGLEDVGPTTDIVALLQKMMIDTFFEEVETAVKEEMAIPPDWKGFTGIKEIFDEWEILQPLSTLSWTPDEFRRMWGTLEHESKVNYVMGLIDGR